MATFNEHSLFSLKLESVMEKITKMFDNQEHCDVTFSIQGRYLEAHKLGLIAQDFQVLNKRKDDAVIQVEDIEYDTFRSIIRYFYAEQIEINTKNIFKLMHAAQVLHEARLSDLCSSFLMRRACADNFVHLINASVEFKNTTLQRQLSTFFGTSMKSVIHDISFKYLSPEAIKLVMGVPIFARDCTDLQFFVMLRRWARAECERQNGGIANGQDIRNIFGDNFRKLRVPFMQSEDVARLVIGKEILTKEEEISLLHFLSLPACLRMNEAQENFPFENKPLSKTFTDIPKGASHIKIYDGNCSLCKAALDGYYGGEMIHCGKCDFDICMRCFSAPQHQHHRSFCCIKTVLGKSDDCCNSCGWPVKSSLFFHQHDSQTEELPSPAATKGDSKTRTTRTAIRALYPGTPNTGLGRASTAYGQTSTGFTSASPGGLFGGTSSTSSGGFSFFSMSSKSGGVVGNASTPPVMRGPDSADSNLKLNSSEEKQERKLDETNLCKNCKSPLKGEKRWTNQSPETTASRDFSLQL